MVLLKHPQPHVPSKPLGDNFVLASKGNRPIDIGQQPKIAHVEGFIDQPIHGSRREHIQNQKNDGVAVDAQDKIAQGMQLG